MASSAGGPSQRMRAPAKDTLTEYRLALRDYFSDPDHARGCCSRCDNGLAWAVCYISLHALELEAGRQECAGPGIVEKLALPYCPRCESLPQSGCIHVPYFSIRRGAVTEPLHALIPTALRTPPYTE